ncbi:membrane-bound lytic murein transglycosylase MltC [Aliivibrio sp. S4TY2]|uniref:Membrane-bound lytic murein transglycosylase MltC n=1 Tax=Aliivibrio finisterrensis TaxID=511998 RepID=A0A4Q5KK23_9GAMM|nr:MULTISPECIES: membrane-bound lytic murein transglycosylase MltC [Aliivibrio]MDD9157324.1 membrane-bound lytic murein transglycosylase MltC [Aliivibrio sp. S4TY2]MDD9161206.1 membrane-bound lytic murein transglycosylase MltC [Aliivibrio sp. S4TY1]MDD9165236.1 membrane-bound lytic murein transglycosylase MltC [Aliivibrio sp. S4MY2]MDD9169234.1 membrane-bound lytic murein transglycosylase MltC [Aliivibrio sp. S4MY4]MDD9175493.1 membrane-bound lytic murein transglycosylase MltC [Aliivibrio sp. 
MKKIILIASACLFLTSCSRESIESTFGVNYDTTNRFAKNLAPLPGQFTKDIKALDSLISSFSGNVEKRWGKNNLVIAGKSSYVKYTDGYLSRSQVNFSTGQVTVETVAGTEPKAHLRQAIITTLLTPDDPAGVDLYSDAAVTLGGKPFLYQQVVDQDNKPIEWSWRASRYADYLIAHHLKTKNIDYKKAYYVDIPMVKNHTQLREYQYADIVRGASQRYDIPEDLIYSIIRTESSFNPYAVSWANAYGLMQVVPKTAGRDVFKLVKNKPGDPTPEYLFNPHNNIDTGTAYFYILKTRYLKDIRNPVSKQYSMISAYNGGAGGVLTTFSSSRSRAIQDINSLNPNQVYWALTKKHKNAEARRYLEKVTAFKKEFNSGKI